MILKAVHQTLVFVQGNDDLFLGTDDGNKVQYHVNKLD